MKNKFSFFQISLLLGKAKKKGALNLMIAKQDA